MTSHRPYVFIRLVFIALPVLMQSAYGGEFPNHPQKENLSDSVVSIPAALKQGSYFGQEAPGTIPKVFAPGLISLPDRRETKIAFSPDGQEVFIGAAKRLFYTKQTSGRWSEIKLAEFLGMDTNADIEPFFAADGNKLFFIRNGHIWVSSRGRDGWEKASPLPPPVNSEADEWHPTVTLDGTLYFCSTRGKPRGGYAIYRALLKDGQYHEIEKLDEIINSRYGAWDPFIAPDGSYLIFSSEQPGGYGGHDQYISYFRNGAWSEPRNLGSAINTNETEYGSYITPDGKYYFFSRPSGWGTNDKADLYWVDSKVVIGEENKK